MLCYIPKLDILENREVKHRALVHKQPPFTASLVVPHGAVQFGEQGRWCFLSTCRLCMRTGEGPGWVAEQPRWGAEPVSRGISGLQAVVIKGCYGSRLWNWHYCGCLQADGDSAL